MKEKKININGLRELLLVGVVLLLCVVWTVMNPQFLSVNNITNILRQASYICYCSSWNGTMIIINWRNCPVSKDHLLQPPVW